MQDSHPGEPEGSHAHRFRDNIRVFDAWMAELRARRGQGYDPLIIAASGNQSRRPTLVIKKASPSEADSVVSVGAIDEDMAIWPR